MTATDTYLLLRAFCDELHRCGVRHACTSPGSRNTPILLSLTRQPGIRCWSHVDERVAGFFALGAAKATNQPVALTCTSGTAAANYLPAVVEAHHARVPLVVLTADRPPELREVGAGQAIDQVKLYGDAVKWFFEVGVDRAAVDTLRWIRQLACRACWTALQGRPGPVHLNFPLREPLVLDAPLPAEDPVPGRAHGRPWTALHTPPPGGPPPRHLPARGVIVAGRHERDPELADAAAALAEAAGYPLLADPLSGARRGEAVIPTYDLLLRDPRLTDRLTPQLVLRTGDLPTSKPLRAWLQSLPADVEQVALDPEAAWQDPAGVLSDVVAGDPAQALRAWTPPAPADAGWLSRWRAADAAATAAIDRELASAPGLSEPHTARLLGETLTRADTLVVASSMPIRDVELYLPAGDDLPRVLANRGANGIDGTIATALGVAAATPGGRVVALIGDVALTHDLGGLATLRRHHLDLTIVLVNNGGGGIFHFLPVSGEADAFEEHVATPPRLDAPAAAALAGLPHVTADTPDDLVTALASPALVEVRTDRAQNLALHRRVAEAALAEAALATAPPVSLSRPAPAASPAA